LSQNSNGKGVFKKVEYKDCG